MRLHYADLAVTAVSAPPQTIGDPARFTYSWTVTNAGTGRGLTDAWVDEAVLSQDDVLGNADDILLGRFPRTGGLYVGAEYSRTETAQLSPGLTGRFRLYVTADAGRVVFENGSEANNTRRTTGFADVMPIPYADLAVSGVQTVGPADSGRPLDVSWVVTNVGIGTTDVGVWTDKVYLATDPTGVNLANGGAPLGTFDHFGHLAPGGGYDRTGRVTLPNGIQGTYYLVVVSGGSGRAGEPFEFVYTQNNTGVSPAVNVSLSPPPDLTVTEVVAPPVAQEGQVVDVSWTVQNVGVGPAVGEWPNETNNVLPTPLYVQPVPLADLVAHDVIAPAQAVEGARVDVTFSVTNKGSGPTDVDRWTDTVWLTRDKNRPNPRDGDYLLTSVARQGGLPVRGRYDRTVSVVIPDGVEPGVWYVTPWADPYAAVTEDPLASNNNPDDPNEQNSNNYKARAITVLATPPDLEVTRVNAPLSAPAGGPFTVTWTVQNKGTGPARPGGWIDRVYLTDRQDPFEKGAKTLLLGEAKRLDPLAVNATYDGKLELTLTPSAAGRFVVVVTDAVGQDEVFRVVREVDETNNRLAAPSVVTPAPADLQVTDVQIIGTPVSGERVTVRYTVTNVGTNPVWGGTRYWRDFLWVSADDTFLRRRASYMGETVYSHAAPLQPGQSYVITTEVVLPQGADGAYSLYIHLDAHNDRNPAFRPYDSRILLTDW